MFYYEGFNCPVCRKPFENGEDIVSCPKCGLPHHRTCWAKEHQCHAAEYHDTEHQWSRENASNKTDKGYVPPEGQPTNAHICPHCFTRNTEFAEFCAHCGNSLGVAEWHSASNSYTPYTAHTPVVSNEDEQALSAIVAVNTQYYIPRFRKIQTGFTYEWNWAAFLLGPLWLFYRKQYLLGGLMFAFQIILDIASMWLMYPIQTATTEADALLAVEQMASNPMMIPATVLSLLILAAHILLGLKGTHLYLHYCNQRIQKARELTPGISVAELSSFGGVSVGTAILFYLLSTLLSNALAALLFM